MAANLENKVRFVVRAFVWEHRANQARKVYHTVQRQREAVREVKDGAKWWFRALTGR